MASRPVYVLFAGINGAGKSTLYRSGLWPHAQSLAGIARINSDEIVAAHGWDPADQRAQIRAGREAIRRMEGHLERRESFDRETTLAGSTIMKSIARAKGLGYEVVLNYVGVEEPGIALKRIAHRVETGGHDIPAEDVLRRAVSSRKNLLRALPLCDEAYLFDNSSALRLVAASSAGKLAFYDDFPRVAWIDEVVRTAPAD